MTVEPSLFSVIAPVATAVENDWSAFEFEAFISAAAVEETAAVGAATAERRVFPSWPLKVREL